MASFVIVAVYLLVALAAPFLVQFGVLDPLRSTSDAPRRHDRRPCPSGSARRHQLATTRSASSPAPAATCFAADATA